MQIVPTTPTAEDADYYRERLRSLLFTLPPDILAAMCAATDAAKSGGDFHGAHIAALGLLDERYTGTNHDTATLCAVAGEFFARIARFAQARGLEADSKGGA